MRWPGAPAQLVRRPFYLLRNQLLLAFGLAWAGSAEDVDVMATYLAPQEEGGPWIVVSLLPKAPGIRVNESPAPRINLDPQQKALIYQPPADRSASPAQGGPRYLDPETPVRFPVKLAPGTPTGTHLVKATITYFYCSKRQGWCKKGTADVEVAVTVR